MASTVLRLVWFAAIAIVAAYAICLVAGNIVNAQTAGLGDPIPVRDVIGPNSHSLSGMVMVPTPCDELAVRTQQVSAVGYELIFTTWRDPSVTSCPSERTPREFDAELFAPATGVNIGASLNGEALSIAVIPVLPAR